MRNPSGRGSPNSLPSRGPAALGWRRHHATKDAHLSSLNALSDRMIWPTSQHTNGHWRQVFQGPKPAPVARKFWQFAAIRDTAIFRRAIGTPAVTVVSPDGLSYLTSAPRQPHRNCDRKTLWVPKCIDSSVARFDRLLLKSVGGRSARAQSSPYASLFLASHGRLRRRPRKVRRFASRSRPSRRQVCPRSFPKPKPTRAA